MCNKLLITFNAVVTLLGDRGHSESVIVLALVQSSRFRAIRHQTKNYPPKYLIYCRYALKEKYRVLYIARDIT